VLRFRGDKGYRDAISAIRLIVPGYRLTDLMPVLRGGHEFSIPMLRDGRTTEAVLYNMRKAGLEVSLE
jgi:hypothetical protein